MAQAPQIQRSRRKTRTYDRTDNLDEVVAYLQTLIIPTGTCLPVYSAISPDSTHWLMLDGATHAKDTYPALYARLVSVLGSALVETDDTFTLPDWRGRAAFGASGAPGLALGTLAGAAEHVLSISELPPHDHPVTDPGHGHPVSDPGHDHPVTDPGHAHAAAVTGAAQANPGTGVTGAEPGSTDTTETGVTVDPATTGVSVDIATTGVSVGQAGGGAPFPLLPPVVAVSWMIKT